MDEAKARKLASIIKKFTMAILVLIVVGLGIIYYQDAKLEEITKRENLTENEFIALTVHDLFNEEGKLLGIDEEDNVKRILLKGAENLTLNMTVDGMVMQAMNLIKELKGDADIRKYKGISVQFDLDFTDSYGNIEVQRACIVTLMSKTIHDINWDNIRIEDIKKIADTYWLNEILSE